MANYTVIADTGEKLVEMLQKQLVPGVLNHPNEIGLRSPEDRGDVSLGLFLYDVKESEEIRQQGNVLIRDRVARAPLYLTLYYMVTAYSSGDVKFRLAQEQRILGRVLQVFHDHPVIPLAEVDKDRSSGTDLHIQLLRMTVDEKSRIWNFPNVGSRLSLFYRVSPVTIDPALSDAVTRVTDVDINVETMTGER